MFPPRVVRVRPAMNSTPTSARTDYVLLLTSTIDEAVALLATLPERLVRWRPAPGAWSAKEIIGHLIDSAANNHRRFVQAESQANLVFAGYAQDEWVRAQAYDDAPWSELLALWSSYNRHLAHVMAAIPASVRYRQHREHNLHEIGWQRFPADSPATLDDLMRDYVGHLRHHVAQVRDRVHRASADGGS
jgi:hypothetical protein